MATPSIPGLSSQILICFVAISYHYFIRIARADKQESVFVIKAWYRWEFVLKQGGPASIYYYTNSG